MARFLVKASEFKNVCKAVNDRKLAELKKEIIEILKKQDENEVKKAIDYFNSQELHYTHLEKSLVSGKWIEKAGYGIGTVRIWKGKKYKKIAPGKWARVFDKEGRGTNIAIGKLIAKVQKIDNVEDLMAFVMANKQRFVDENGVDLPVLDKLRAAVGVKNENLSGESSSYTYGVGEDVSREKNKIFEGKEKITKEEADLHKVSRKFEQIPTTELKQRKAKLERWIENKTRNKRDSLNNAIFRESYQKELDAINAVLDKRNGKKETSKPAEKYDAKAYEEEKDNILRHTNKDFDSIDAAIIDLSRHKNWINRKPSDETEHEKNVREARLKAVDDIIEGLKRGDDKLLDKFVKEKPAEKYDDDKAYEGKLATQKQVDEATAISNKYEVSRNEMLKKPITTIQKYANSNINDIPEKLKTLNDFIEYQDGLSNPDYKQAGKDYARLKNHELAREIWQKVEDGEAEWDDNGYLKLDENGLLAKPEKKEESNSEDIKVGQYKKPIGTFTKSGENTVEMPATKATKELFDSLNKAKSVDKNREFMTDCYYDGENLVATDGKRLTIIKTGNVGFEPGYVNVKTDGGKVTLERIEGKEKEYRFPNYKKAIPENNDQEVKLDNKALKDKLKQMKKEGAFNKKNPRVNLVFEDGKVMLDGTLIGTGDVKFKDGENYVSFNGDFLNDAVSSGDNMSMSFGKHSEKAVVFGTDISKTVVMPMTQTPVDYESNRASKKQIDDKKVAKLSNNRKENERLVSDSFKDIEGQVEKVYSNLDKKINAFSDEDLKRNYDMLNLNMDKIMDRSINFISTIVDKKTNATFASAYAYSKLKEKHPDVKDKFLAEMEKRGISVKKSLFDDLFEIEVIEDEEVEEDPEENDSLFNDYSAEQPELFNSTELMVREAFNRCRVL